MPTDLQWLCSRLWEQSGSVTSAWFAEIQVKGAVVTWGMFHSSVNAGVNENKQPAQIHPGGLCGNAVMPLQWPQ